MRKLFTIALTFCIALTFALANAGNASATSDQKSKNQIQVFAAQNIDYFAPSLDELPFELYASDSKKKECPCKKMSGSFEFVCGITMAFMNDAAAVCPPHASKTVAIYSNSIIPKALANLLKRPPRPIL